MATITSQQIKIIHTLVSELKWTRYIYESFLDGYGVASCKELTEEQAAIVVYKLTELVEGDRDDRTITAKQISYIKYLWLSVDYDQCNNGDRNLQTFLIRKYGADAVEKLSRKHAFGAIAAIKRMAANKGKPRPTKPKPRKQERPRGDVNYTISSWNTGNGETLACVVGRDDEPVTVGFDINTKNVN